MKNVGAFAILGLVFLSGCGSEDFDQSAYSREVNRLVSEAVQGTIYDASLVEVGRGDVRVDLNFNQSPGDIVFARRAALGYCERLVSSIHEKLDPNFPNLTFASCRAGMNRGGMRDVYGAVRYGPGVGFKIRDQ